MEKKLLKAIRENVTFTELGGTLNIIDIFALPLLTRAAHGKCLDNLYKALNKEVKDAGENESIILKTVKTNTTLDLKFELVKYIIGIKLAEEEAAAAAKEKKEKMDELLGLLAEQEASERKGMSKEQLLAEIAKLQG